MMLVEKYNVSSGTMRWVVGCEYCHHPIHDNEDDGKQHVHLVTHQKGHRAHRLNFCDYDCVRIWLSNGQISMWQERAEQAKQEGATVWTGILNEPEPVMS